MFTYTRIGILYVVMNTPFFACTEAAASEAAPPTEEPSAPPEPHDNSQYDTAGQEDFGGHEDNGGHEDYGDYENAHYSVNIEMSTCFYTIAISMRNFIYCPIKGIVLVILQ